MKHTRSRRPIILIGLVSFGLVLMFVSWTGLQQLATLGEPSSTTMTLNELPVLKPVWEFFAPNRAQVVISQVASKVQMTFLLLGLSGLILIIASIYLLAIFSSRKQRLVTNSAAS
jgi:hypothetical protein